MRSRPFQIPVLHFPHTLQTNELLGIARPHSNFFAGVTNLPFQRRPALRTTIIAVPHGLTGEGGKRLGKAGLVAR